MALATTQGRLSPSCYPMKTESTTHLGKCLNCLEDHTMDTKERIALILVTTDDDWLTDNGEIPASDGWDLLKEQISEQLSYKSHGVGLTVKTEFIEWEDEEL